MAPTARPSYTLGVPLAVGILRNRGMGMSEQPYDPTANPYPKIRYHAIHGETAVANAEEEAALGPGWFDSPNIHERLLLKYGESSESQTRRKGDIERACDAFDQRLEKIEKLLEQLVEAQRGH